MAFLTNTRITKQLKSEWKKIQFNKLHHHWTLDTVEVTAYSAIVLTFVELS